ncbi:hypothetical protein [uncultured Pseudokineococcus sp.]|uniref:hypothetical protein n=1 Tax=uncultured Pseudokineococcus sp. TaxID=1642928 RepID=UPI00261B5A08|nr:hypothetical protein [uncultured Pseudokineococcus sp.]
MLTTSFVVWIFNAAVQALVSFTEDDSHTGLQVVRAVSVVGFLALAVVTARQLRIRARESSDR